MSRPLRIAYFGAWYHVMNRGLARQRIFFNNNHREIFLKLLFEIRNRYQAEIHAYCLMDNHYHLLIRTPLGNISRIMRHLDGVYTQRFNNSTKRDGPLFRGRYKAILIEADIYLLRLSRYIHLNPVKARMVKKSEKYKWSSYSAFLSGDEPHWLFTKSTLDYFGCSNQRQKYKLFVEEGIDDEVENFYKKVIRLSILGTEAFVKNVTEKYLKERHKVHEIPEHKLLTIIQSDCISKIIRKVTDYYQISEQDIQSPKPKNKNYPRMIGMYLAQMLGQYSFNEIAAFFTNISPSGVSKTCKRVLAKIESDVRFKEEIEEIEKEIYMSKFAT